MTNPPEDLLNIFWVEATEYLEALNAILLQLEVAGPEENHTAELREISRIAHSLKGAARAVGLSTIETLAHQMEDVFDGVQEGRFALSPDICDALYDALDVIQVYTSGGEAEPETVEAVRGQLRALAAAGQPAGPDQENGQRSAPAKPKAKQVKPPAPVEPAAPPKPVPAPSVEAAPAPSAAARATEDTVRVSLAKLDQLMGQASELLIARMHGEQRRSDLHALLQEHHRWQRIWRQARSAYIRTIRRLRDMRELSTAADGGADLLMLLDFIDATQHYMTQAGRSLLTLNRDLAQDNLHLTSLVDGLQADIASVRMLPFETILNTFQRMVRDLAHDGGKEVSLVVKGAEVELDKHVLELLKDPLMHILRNSVDHGIELPAQRIEAGKAPQGTITLRVASRGSDIHVSVSDDGRGINPDVVRERAVAAGLIGEAEAESLSRQEAIALVLEPGFSTASQVTAVSGRGVGLDVVRQRVEALRGRLWIENTPGKGVTFHLIVPVSLTRIRCLLARAGDESYAIPLTSVARIITVRPEEVFTVEDRPMIQVLGRPMPLVYLRNVLERPGAPPPLGEHTPVLVLRSTERGVAFIIDELLSEQELVLKTLGSELSRIRNVAGAAILGTGDVVIVLNTSDLIKSARRARTIITETPAAEPEEPAVRAHWILVVDDSLTTRTLEKNILEAAGYRVRTATDGTEAIQTLIEHPCDVIVADVEMPHMNGFELAQRVKSDARWKEIPFILVTSLDSPTDRERGLRAGADAYLVKTRFDQDELLQTIEQLV